MLAAPSCHVAVNETEESNMSRLHTRKVFDVSLRPFVAPKIDSCDFMLSNAFFGEHNNRSFFWHICPRKSVSVVAAICGIRALCT